MPAFTSRESHCRIGRRVFLSSVVALLVFVPLKAQEKVDSSVNQSRAEEVRRGSQTAKGGFQNEDEIRDKFNSWTTDPEAQLWLTEMKFQLNDVSSVLASKPHGHKADVEVRVKTTAGEHIEGISIKLVSTDQGFNQIDKRWLKHYAEMWSMPNDVHVALRQYVGEVAPIRQGRNERRMFLDELDAPQRDSIVRFFETHQSQIVSDLFAGDDQHAAKWMLVVRKQTDSTTHQASEKNWTLHSITDVIKFFGNGKVELTSAGNLKIGKISMQRKGGDNGRDTANMLQFKINPAELFSLQKLNESL